MLERAVTADIKRIKGREKKRIKGVGLLGWFLCEDVNLNVPTT